MKLQDPILFESLFMERVWGGRRLETVLGKKLPPGIAIGESWEIVDREDAQSVVHEGPFQRKTLHDLWVAEREEVFGKGYVNYPQMRFPILLKLLDARECLSVQVHPPEEVAPLLYGEAKTEMWYFLDCLPSAMIYAGLKADTTREGFEKALKNGKVEESLRKISVTKGDSIFIPSGCPHAIGGGCLLVEVQQNSDTTYRVFDWNRVGIDGQPRKLHLLESLASIQFANFEPRLKRQTEESEHASCASSPYFQVERWFLRQGRRVEKKEHFAIFTVIAGRVRCGTYEFGPGQTFLVPGCAASQLPLYPAKDTAEVLCSTLP